MSVSRETGQLGFLIQAVAAVFEAWKARPLLHPRYGVFELENVEVSAGREPVLRREAPRF